MPFRGEPSRSFLGIGPVPMGFRDRVIFVVVPSIFAWSVFRPARSVTFYGDSSTTSGLAITAIRGSSISMFDPSRRRSAGISGVRGESTAITRGGLARVPTSRLQPRPGRLAFLARTLLDLGDLATELDDGSVLTAGSSVAIELAAGIVEEAVLDVEVDEVADA